MSPVAVSVFRVVCFVSILFSILAGMGTENPSSMAALENKLNEKVQAIHKELNIRTVMFICIFCIEKDYGICF